MKLMTPLKWLFAMEIAAFADQAYSVTEVRGLMFEASAVVANLTGTVQAVLESVTSIAAVEVVVVTVDLGLATKLQNSAGFVAALEPQIVVACQVEFRAIAAVAAVAQQHYHADPTVADDEYLIGCFAGSLTAAVAAASWKDYSAGLATSAAVACLGCCFDSQLAGSVACLQNLAAALLDAAAAAAAVALAISAAAALVFAVDE